MLGLILNPEHRSNEREEVFQWNPTQEVQNTKQSQEKTGDSQGKFVFKNTWRYHLFPILLSREHWEMFEV